jgi:hypothetical protein
VPSSRGQGSWDVQTNVFSIFDRATHLGVVVRRRELFFLTSIRDIASDVQLQHSQLHNDVEDGCFMPWDGMLDVQASRKSFGISGPSSLCLG